MEENTTLEENTTYEEAARAAAAALAEAGTAWLSLGENPSDYQKEAACGLLFIAYRRCCGAAAASCRMAALAQSLGQKAQEQEAAATASYWGEQVRLTLEMGQALL